MDRVRVVEAALDDAIATAIRIGNPASWQWAVEAAEESGGSIRAVTDPQIMAAFRLVARHGVFAEMASSASIAGLLELKERGDLEPGQTVVCVLTGHGLKDPEWAISDSEEPVTIPPEAEAAAIELGLR